jgi:hypothetical protein
MRMTGSFYLHEARNASKLRKIFVCGPQRVQTHFDYVRRTNRIMLFRELIGVNYVKHT